MHNLAPGTISTNSGEEEGERERKKRKYTGGTSNPPIETRNQIDFFFPPIGESSVGLWISPDDDDFAVRLYRQNF